MPQADAPEAVLVEGIHLYLDKTLARLIFTSSVGKEYGKRV